MTNEEAVAIGIGRTGRVITAAALMIAVVFLAFGVSSVFFMKQIAVGAGGRRADRRDDRPRAAGALADAPASASGTGGRRSRCAASTSASASPRPETRLIAAMCQVPSLSIAEGDAARATAKFDVEVDAGLAVVGLDAGDRRAGRLGLGGELLFQLRRAIGLEPLLAAGTPATCSIASPTDLEVMPRSRSPM